ncbi:hypothetical protein [Burkholderia mayonis]|uniref:hypothetical protein n=1 Tax=Burkholderia mayonis TaxID=1385591 RepID=UPI00131ED23E|nr:hypothetical protein [Burkholderia mayonis]
MPLVFSLARSGTTCAVDARLIGLRPHKQGIDDNLAFTLARYTVETFPDSSGNLRNPIAPVPTTRPRYSGAIRISNRISPRGKSIRCFIIETIPRH